MAQLPVVKLLAGIKNSTQSAELFYLDLSKPFDTSNILWNLIHDGDLPIYTYGSTTVVSLDNSTIFLIGGYIKNKTTSELDYSKQVYAYDYSTSKWTTPSITGDNVPIRQQMTGVINNKGIIYIFGGYNTTNATEEVGITYNEINTLNTHSMTWKNLSIINNLPPVSSDYSASLLPNGIIVYVGGQEKNDTLTKMNSIKLFDTNKDEWSYMDAIGDEVDPRWIFASVLNSSKVNPPPYIYGHAGNLYYNNMIVTF
ncbi:12299_t:CDS:2, partial [Dentiscutata erythropus]